MSSEMPFVLVVVEYSFTDEHKDKKEWCMKFRSLDDAYNHARNAYRNSNGMNIRIDNVNGENIIPTELLMKNFEQELIIEECGDELPFN